MKLQEQASEPTTTIQTSLLVCQYGNALDRGRNNMTASESCDYLQTSEGKRKVHNAGRLHGADSLVNGKHNIGIWTRAESVTENLNRYRDILKNRNRHRRRY